MSCSSKGHVHKVYVYRRPFSSMRSLPRACLVDHSGLILKMTDGKKCVLEYDLVNNGTVALYDAKYETCYKSWTSKPSISFTDWQGKKFNKYVVLKFAGYVSPRKCIKPKQVFRMMQQLMGPQYHFLHNNCHVAQQRVRRKLKLIFKNRHLKNWVNPIVNPKPLCTCVNSIKNTYLFQVLSRNPVLKMTFKNFCFIKG